MSVNLVRLRHILINIIKLTNFALEHKLVNWKVPFLIPYRLINVLFWPLFGSIEGVGQTVMVIRGISMPSCTRRSQSGNLVGNTMEEKEMGRFYFHIFCSICECFLHCILKFFATIVKNTQTVDGPLMAIVAIQMKASVLSHNYSQLQRYAYGVYICRNH